MGVDVQDIVGARPGSNLTLMVDVLSAALARASRLPAMNCASHVLLVQSHRLPEP